MKWSRLIGHHSGIFCCHPDHARLEIQATWQRDKKYNDARVWPNPRFNYIGEYACDEHKGEATTVQVQGVRLNGDVLQQARRLEDAVNAITV